MADNIIKQVKLPDNSTANIAAKYLINASGDQIAVETILAGELASLDNVSYDYLDDDLKAKLNNSSSIATKIAGINLSSDINISLGGNNITGNTTTRVINLGSLDLTWNDYDKTTGTSANLSVKLKDGDTVLTSDSENINNVQNASYADSANNTTYLNGQLATYYATADNLSSVGTVANAANNSVTAIINGTTAANKATNVETINLSTTNYSTSDASITLQIGTASNTAYINKVAEANNAGYLETHNAAYFATASNLSDTYNIANTANNSVNTINNNKIELACLPEKTIADTVINVSAENINLSTKLSNIDAHITNFASGDETVGKANNSTYQQITTSEEAEALPAVSDNGVHIIFVNNSSITTFTKKDGYIYLTKIN